MKEQNPETQNELSRSAKFFIGLGIGCIPLILAILGFGASAYAGVFLLVGGALYLVSILAAIACCVFPRSRFIGYGLLAMAGATPVIAFIACTVRLTIH
jgi:hypothetical protein